MHKPENYIYNGKGKALKMSRDSIGSYSIPIIINQDGKDEIDSELFIDIGTNVPIMVAINDESMVHKPEGAMKKILVYGASGEIYGYNGIIKSVMLSNYQLNDVISNFIESDSDNTTCTIGLPLLMRFNLVFDYFNELLYIEPNMKFNDPFTKE